MRIKPRMLLVALVTIVCAWAAGAGAASAKTVWLCRPGVSPDPCTPGLSTTVYSPKLKPLRVEHPAAVKNPGIDCFYVYPTVSDQKTTFANLHIDPVERAIALYQAARYSQFCKMYAPMYRQLTLSAILQRGSTINRAEPLTDVRNAFRTYLQKYNHGRGFVLIGHSQGSFVLRQLIAKDVDPKPSVRRRLLSAILLGGNVLVKQGSTTGGDFKHIGACESPKDTGCVIAWSTFNAPVPADSLFGRAATGFGGEPATGDEVLCTNPADLGGGGSGQLHSIYPSEPFAPGTTIGAGTQAVGTPDPAVSTPWFASDAYTGGCSSADDANVLQIAPVGGAPTLNPVPDATWGLHLVDANIALGNLTDITAKEIKAYSKG
jgi:hypothetical protein